MTTPKKDGSIYLWLMGGQISLILMFMGMVGSFMLKQSDYMVQNERDHQKILNIYQSDSTWTRWVHRNQIIPAYELSYTNEKDLKVIKKTLLSIDSNLMVNNSHFKRVFLFLRENRVDGKAKYEN